MRESNHDKLKSILVSILDQFVKVCEDNHLTYYLAYGTVLGAIRHHGMIPWDDDIDVHMPRTDYEKLRTLPTSVWGGYQLTAWDLTPNNQYHFLKLEDPDTTLIEVADPLYVGGIYIDIFPLDNAPKNKIAFREQLNSIAVIQDKYDILCIRSGADCKGLINYIKYKWRKYRYAHQNIQIEWEKIATFYQSEDELLMDYHAPKVWHHKPMLCKWFGEGVLAEYEGKKYVVPENTDAYLTHLYGDYMTPPPLDKRYTHEYVYVNLEHRIVGDERQKVIKDIEKRYSFSFSFADEIKYWKTKLG